MKYRQGLNLEPYLKKYDYFPRFIFGEIAQDIRNRGYLNKNDFALICIWKSLMWQLFDQRREQASMWRLDTSEEKIKRKTQKMFEINHMDRNAIVGVLKDLRVIEGVGVKVASAILSVVFPQHYGIFDKHVKDCLGVTGEDEESCTEAIMKMRRIAEEQSKITFRHWTPRMVDKALWKLGQDQSQT